jgi:hypothetical protein
VSISDKINDLITKLCIDEDTLYKEIKDDPTVIKWDYTTQYRLISTKHGIKEINPLSTYKEEEIEDNEILLLLPVSQIAFSEVNKGNFVYLDSRNKIAFKQGSDEHQIVISDQGYSLGKTYCEFILLTEPYEKSVIIGVTPKRVDYNFNPNESKNFWGFILSDCKKMGYKEGRMELVEYGDVTKIGDRVGILMEATDEGVDITFFINKINMGVAHKGLPPGIYYPGVILGYDGTRVKITNKVGYPDV